MIGAGAWPLLGLLCACSSAQGSPDATPNVPPRLDPGERLVEGEGFRVIVPASWKDLPDLQPSGTRGTTVGDPRQAVFFSVVHTTVTGQSDPATAARSFLTELKQSLVDGGASVRRWDLEETPVGLRARATVEQGEMRAEGVHLAVVDTARVLHGFSADCLSKTIAPDPTCERVLSSFDVTVKRP